MASSPQQLKIDVLAYGGDGVARPADAPVTFVPLTAAGDTVEVTISETHKNFSRATLLRVIDGGPDRVAAPCPHYSACGGCQLMHVSLSGQRAAKVGQLSQALARIGQLDHSRVNPMIAAESTHYRNKLVLHWDAATSRFAMVGRTVTERVPLDTCLIAQEPIVRGLAYAHKVLANYAAPAEHKAMIPRSLVLRSTRDGALQIAVVFELGTDLTSASAFGAALWDARSECPELKSVWVNIYGGRRDPVFGDKFVHCGGAETITERIGNLAFHIQPDGFFQSHTAGAEKLYREVARLAHVDKTETVADLYSGTGGIALTLAPHAAKVIAVEDNTTASRLARKSAHEAGIENIETINKRSEVYLKTVRYGRSKRADVIVVDPPRTGLSPRVRELLIATAPKRMIYVSCNPTTLARDVASLKEHYDLREVTPLDMFPHTYHLEAVALLTRKRRK